MLRLSELARAFGRGLARTMGVFPPRRGFYATGGAIQGPGAYDSDAILVQLSEGVHWLPPDDVTPEQERAFFETAFPATLRPAECVFDRTYRCIRDDHNHGGEATT